MILLFGDDVVAYDNGGTTMSWHIYDNSKCVYGNGWTILWYLAIVKWRFQLWMQD